MVDEDRLVEPVSKTCGVHPTLVGKVQRIVASFHELGLDLVVTDGLRTAEQQAALYAQGRTKPGNIVTHCDGVTTKSNHQAKEDGLGHALDVTFLVGGKPSWDKSLPWDLLGAAAKQQGLNWGGNFSTLRDLPHLELP